MIILLRDRPSRSVPNCVCMQLRWMEHQEGQRGDFVIEWFTVVLGNWLRSTFSLTNQEIDHSIGLTLYRSPVMWRMLKDRYAYSVPL